MAAPPRVHASPLQRPLPRGERTVSLSAFAALFAETVSYFQGRVTSMNDLETRLEAAGRDVGVRFLELAAFREKPGRRETTVVGMLTFVSGPAWQSLFGKTADALEKSTEQAHTFQIREDVPITNQFISMPKDYSRVNVAAYVAGIIRGMMEAASFVRLAPCLIFPGRAPRSPQARALLSPLPPASATLTAALHRQGRHGPRRRGCAFGQDRVCHHF